MDEILRGRLWAVVLAIIILLTIERIAMESRMFVGAVERIWQGERDELLRLVGQQGDEVITDAILFGQIKVIFVAATATATAAATVRGLHRSTLNIHATAGKNLRGLGAG